MQVPQRLKIFPSYYFPSTPLLGIYLKECNLNTCTPIFIAALLTIPKLCNQPNCSTTEEDIKKM
jgi:hypothetical protein